MRYGTRGWLGLAGYIAVVEAAAPAGETLSERMDGWLDKHPGRAMATAVTIVTAAHLLNMLPERFDPIHRAFAAMGKHAMTEPNKVKTERD